MHWIFVAVFAGSIVTSGHETREACEGRRAIMAEQKIVGLCVEAPRAATLQTFPSGIVIGGIGAFDSQGVWHQ